MNTPSLPSLLIGFCFCIGCAGAAVSLDGLATNSPFMLHQEPSAAPVVTEGVSLEFRGMIATKEGFLFGLYDRSLNRGAWVRENQSGADFIVQSYNVSEDLVTVNYQGRTMTLPLSMSRVGTATASVVPALPPAGSNSGNAAVRLGPPEGSRLEAVAAEVRRRRALRQAVTTGTPAPAAAVPASSGATQ